MPKWFLTFGQQYRREPHPIGMGANPDGYVEVYAQDELHARSQVIELIGTAWSMLYSEHEFFGLEEPEGMRSVDYFPDGCSGTIKNGELTLNDSKGEDHARS